MPVLAYSSTGMVKGGSSVNRQTFLETLYPMYKYLKKALNNPVDTATAVVPGGIPMRLGYEALKRLKKNKVKPKISMRESNPVADFASMTSGAMSTVKSGYNAVKGAASRGYDALKGGLSHGVKKAKQAYNIASKKIPRKIGNFVSATKPGFKPGLAGGMAYGAMKSRNVEESERGEKDEVEMTKKSFKKEHKHLFKVLKKCKHGDCKKELKKQKKEYREEIKESIQSRNLLMSLIESAPKTIAQMAKDGYGRPMLGNLRSSINPSAKSAGVSFAKDAKKLKKSSVGSLFGGA